MKRSNTPRKRKGRPPRLPSVLPTLRKLGVFRLADARRARVSQASLSRLVQAGQIEKLGGGLYLHPDASIPYAERDFAVACARFGPDSVVGGMTALFYYNLIEQVPSQVWVMVPYRKQTRNRLYRCIRTKTSPRKGVVVRKHYRITSVERSIAEAFRYSSRIGLRTAARALRTAIASKQTTLAKVYAQARELGITSTLQKHWEALVPESEAYG